MSVLTKYIFKRSIGPFLIGLGGFIVFVSVEVLYQLSYIIVRNRVGFDKLLLLIYYYLPYFISMGIPVGVLLAIFWTVSDLSEKRELMAFQVHGISLKYLIVPFLLFAGILSLFSYFLNDSIVPKSQVKIDEVMARYIYKRPHVESYLVEDAVVKHDNKFIYVQLYNKKKNKMKNILIIEYEHGIKKVTTANEAIREDKYWYLIDGRFYLVDEKGFMKFNSKFQKMRLRMDSDFGRMISASSPKKMSHKELVETIKAIEDKKRSARWVVELQTRYSTSLSPVIIVLVGLSLSLLFNLTSKSWGVIITFIIVVLYQGSGAWLSAMGKEYIIPPVLSAWIPNIFFGIFGLVIYLFIDTKFAQTVREIFWRSFIIVILLIPSIALTKDYTITASSVILKNDLVIFTGNVSISENGTNVITAASCSYFLDRDYMMLYNARFISKRENVPFFKAISFNDATQEASIMNATITLNDATVTIESANFIVHSKKSKLYLIESGQISIKNHDGDIIKLKGPLTILKDSSELKIIDSNGQIKITSKNGNTIKGTYAKYGKSTSSGFKGYILTKIKDEEKKLYISGLHLTIKDSNLYTVKGGYLTTCDIEDPHYYIAFERAEVESEKYLVARNVVFFVLDTPIFYFPFFYQSLGKNPLFEFSIKFFQDYTGSSYTFNAPYSKNGIASFTIKTGQENTEYSLNLEDSFDDTKFSLNKTLGDSETFSLKLSTKLPFKTSISINQSEETELYNLTSSYDLGVFSSKLQIYRNYSDGKVFWMLPSIYIKSKRNFSIFDTSLKLSYFTHKQTLYYDIENGGLFQNMGNSQAEGKLSVSLYKTLLKDIGSKLSLSNAFSYYLPPPKEAEENQWDNHITGKFYIFSSSMNTELINLQTSEIIEFSRSDNSEDTWRENFSFNHSSELNFTPFKPFTTKLTYTRKSSFYRDYSQADFQKSGVDHHLDLKASLTLPLLFLTSTLDLQTSYDFLNEEKPWEYPLISLSEKTQFEEWELGATLSTRYLYDEQTLFKEVTISMSQIYKHGSFKNNIKFVYELEEEKPVDEIVDTFSTKYLPLFGWQFNISGLGKIKLRTENPKLYYFNVKGHFVREKVKNVLNITYNSPVDSDESYFTMGFLSKGGDPSFSLNISLKSEGNIITIPDFSLSLTKKLHKWILTTSMSFSLIDRLRFSKFILAFKLGDFPDKYFQYDAINDSFDLGVM